MTRPVRFAALALSGALLFTGCSSAQPPAAEPAPTQPLVVGSTHTPEPTPTVETSPTPAPTETAPALPTSAPECEQLLPVAWLQERLDDRIEEMTGTGPFTANGLPGPVAKKAFETASVLRRCGWGIPYSDGGFHVTILTITPEAETELDTALSSSSVYTAQHGHNRSIYSRVWDDGIGWGFAQGFDSGYWVVSSGTMVSPETTAELVGKTLDVLVAATG